MSFAKTIAALEEFTEEVNSEIVNVQPTDGQFEGEIAGVDFPQESGAIDEDLTQITEAAQGLEDIISLVEEAPGEADQPLQPFVEKAVNVALESNDMVEAAGNPVDSSKDKTKSEVLNKIKDFAKKVWDMLRNFGKKIVQWIRDTWTKFTDRIVKNANQAQKIIEATKTLATTADAKITDKGLLAKIATHQNIDLGVALMNVSEHAETQGNKHGAAIVAEATHLVIKIAEGSEGSDDALDNLFKELVKAGGAYQDKATAEQAKIVGASEGTQTLLSAPFLGGYRAWYSVPGDATEIAKWKHGIGKVDAVKPAESIAAPDANEIKAIAEYVLGLGTLVKIYQGNLKKLDDLNKVLDRAAAKALSSTTADKKQLAAIQAVIPRVLKGTQVSAYAYATSASTIALQYCLAAIAAHRGEKSLTEKAGEVAGKASAAAGAAKDKVTGAFGKKAK